MGSSAGAAEAAVAMRDLGEILVMMVFSEQKGSASTISAVFGP
jgi:hypothetical protein